MQIDPEDFKRHYALLSDAALLEIDRDELVDVGARVLRRGAGGAQFGSGRTRKRARASPDLQPTAHSARRTAACNWWELSFRMEEANFARGLLQSADIPCSLENDSRPDIADPARCG